MKLFLRGLLLVGVWLASAGPTLVLAQEVSDSNEVTPTFPPYTRIYCTKDAANGSVTPESANYSAHVRADKTWDIYFHIMDKTAQLGSKVIKGVEGIKPIRDGNNVDISTVKQGPREQDGSSAIFLPESTEKLLSGYDSRMPCFLAAFFPVFTMENFNSMNVDDLLAQETLAVKYDPGQIQLIRLNDQDKCAVGKRKNKMTRANILNLLAGKIDREDPDYSIVRGGILVQPGLEAFMKVRKVTCSVGSATR